MSGRPRSPREAEVMPAITRERSMAECDALVEAAVSARRAGDGAAEIDALQACIEHPCAAHELDVLGCWEDLARLHHRHGRLDEAIEAWEQAIAGGYRSAPHPRANIAELLVECGRRDEADALYGRLRARCSDDVWLYNSAGYAYAAAGDHETALRWIDAGLDLALASGDPEQVVDQLADMRAKSLGALGRDPADDLVARIESFERPAGMHSPGRSFGEAEVETTRCEHCGWDPSEERATRMPVGEVSALADALRSPRQVSQPVRSDKVGRNYPCPCGSGQKYKRCHGR